MIQTTQTIQSRQNRLIKTIRRLRECKASHAFLEGPHLVGECRGAGLAMPYLLMTPEFLADERGARLSAELGRDPIAVTAPVLASLADAGSPQGVLAVVELPRSGVESLPIVDGGIYLFLDRVQDPGNLGALVRSAEATRASGVAIAPASAHPNHPKALRASAGSLLRVPVAVGASIADLSTHLATISPSVVGLDSTAGRDLYATDLEGTLVLVLGSEGAGLSTENRRGLDLVVTIPSAPPVESLNVTVAASVVLHELARRRRDLSS